jgi:hypothetical protein
MNLGDMGKFRNILHIGSLRHNKEQGQKGKWPNRGCVWGTNAMMKPGHDMEAIVGIK